MGSDKSKAPLLAEKGSSNEMEEDLIMNGTADGPRVEQIQKMFKDSPEPKRRPSPRLHKVVHGNITN